MIRKSFELNEQTLSVIEEIGGHMPGGFFIYQAAEPETLIYANRAVLRIFGCADLEEFKTLTGFTFRGMVHPEDYRSISESLQQQIGKSEDAMDFIEYRIIRKDGEIRWVNDYGHYSETETYGGVYVVFISDITEKRAQRMKGNAIREGEKRALQEKLIRQEQHQKELNSMITARASDYRSIYHVDAVIASPTIYLDGKVQNWGTKLYKELGFIDMV